MGHIANALIALTAVGLLAIAIHYAVDITADYSIIAFGLAFATVFAPTCVIIRWLQPQSAKPIIPIIVAAVTSAIPTGFLMFAYYFLDLKEKLDEIIGIIGDWSLIVAVVALFILGVIAIYHNRGR